ncbi:MAG: hypothetical protein ASARMPRED_008325 [Alectoria sarmentosa]|nr:MAG: hypothetical protein ASARMPRED_008325 [Alectoria sarmentosa]
MDIVQDVERDFMSSKPKVQATSTPDGLYLEPMTEYRGTRDEADLARFGKRQQLDDRSVFQAGLANGGPSGLVYGYIFVWLGVISQVLVMAELASMIPLSGGQYNWVAVISPKFCSKFLSYLTGWMTVIGWQAALASGAFLGGTMIQGLLVLNYPSYGYQRWQGTLLFYAILVVALFVNTYLAHQLPQIESMVLIIHGLGFFAILVPLVYLAPQSTAKDVFATLSDSGDWSSNGISFFIGLSTSMFAFIGIDAAAHLGHKVNLSDDSCLVAEEINDASVVIPRSMLSSVFLNGALGFGMLVAVLFSAGNIQTALDSPTKYPFIEIFAQAVGSNKGATGMVAVIISTTIFATVGLLATASRMTWAFAREQGLPASVYLSRVLFPMGEQVAE